VTNQRPRNYKKLGTDYETLKAWKPDIIWLGVTGFGPESNEAAYDPILQAKSGLMEMTGEPDGSPQVLGIPLPDMGTSAHAYGLLMKALFKRAVSGQGSRIDLSMFESSVSWLTVPVTMTASFGKPTARRGNTHEFFCPVSVFKTNDGFVDLAVGNDRQWSAMVSHDIFKSLSKPAYVENSGRVRDVDNLNKAINKITQNHSSQELIDLLKSFTVPISRINTIPDMIDEPLVSRRLLYSKDSKTGKRITLAPPPHMTRFLEKQDRMLSFPPRFGEHNLEIYGHRLGYTEEDLSRLKEKGVI
ncbi:MAG: CaiB/BaiF CoA-transferase family protein, partial [Desulfobacterales bacterium]|nr:CaiB/BaiF CoA-transferase family protein [Desulfobacterales bacterium]